MFRVSEYCAKNPQRTFTNHQCNKQSSSIPLVSPYLPDGYEKKKKS